MGRLDRRKPDPTRPAPSPRARSAAPRHITRPDAAAATDSTGRADELAAARALVERDFRRRSLTLNEVARAAHLSPFHFHRLFHRQYGQTPKQLISALRIAEVQRLVLAGVPLKHAADAAGFAHQSHMTTRFKQFVGVPPRQWLRTVTSTDDGGAGNSSV